MKIKTKHNIKSQWYCEPIAIYGQIWHLYRLAICLNDTALGGSIYTIYILIFVIYKMNLQIRLKFTVLFQV